MRKFKKRNYLFVLLSGLFLLCIAGLANATTEWTIQKFYVQIDSVTFSSGNFNYWITNSNYIGPAGGEKFYGMIGYDAANIPNAGNYAIAWGDGTFPYDAPANEYQNWSFRMQNIFGYEGFPYTHILNSDPVLRFNNGRMIGIDCSWTNDLLDWGGPAYEYIYGDKLFAWGTLYCPPNLMDAGDFIVLGSLHFIPTPMPEPATILLLSLGIAGLAGIRKKIS